MKILSPAILISIDGMRPDAISEVRTPTLHRFMQNGSSTLKAQCVMPSSTLTCHTSMLRGVDTPRHGITSNTFHPLVRPVPSLFDVATAAGLRCGAFFNWGQLRDLYDPESVVVSYYEKTATIDGGDQGVTSAFESYVAREHLDFSFVYLGRTDEVGHVHGWMSPEYLHAVAEADACVERVLQAMLRKGLDPHILVQSDHGGHERTHGTDMPEDMTIPWILRGPRVAAGRVIERDVKIYDTPAMLAKLLGLELPREWDGRVVDEALVGPLL